MHIRQRRQRIGRRAGKGHHRHPHRARNPRLIQHLLGLAAARNGDKHLITRGVAEKDIAAVAGAGDKRRLAQHL